MSIETISTDAIRQRLADGRAIRLVDVRSPAEFQSVHARGAISMPLERLQPSQIAPPGADELLCVMCQSGSRSLIACEKLAAAGLTAYSVQGGIGAWESAGLPVDRGGRAVISIERQVRLVAGLLVLLGIGLMLAVHPYFVAIPLFIGAGLTFSGITGYCGMGMLLARMPWNQASDDSARCIQPHAGG
jgi:rhodanese-related sulfurtransferase